eukprot:4098844-Pleurochrysis_carterae.AAC.2
MMHGPFPSYPQKGSCHNESILPISVHACLFMHLPSRARLSAWAYSCPHPCFADVFFNPGMSWCASLGPSFWEGYRELIPKDPGFADRAVLYELYHKLNHYNMFGGGYYTDSLGLLGQLARLGDKKLED